VTRTDPLLFDVHPAPPTAAVAGVIPALRPALPQAPATPTVGRVAPQRLTTVVAGVSTRAGQGLSTFMLHAAWETATTHRVVLIDMDETGGTIAEALHLPRRTVERQSVESFYTGESVSPERIHANAIPLRARPQLSVVPGRSAGTCGPGLDAILPRMAGALRSIDCDYVFLDLGPCLAYPGLINPDAVVQAIRRVSTRVVCVLSTDPLPFQHALQVLRRLGNRLLPDVVMWRWGKDWERDLVATWREELPGLPIRSLLDWSDAQYNSWLLSGRPALDVRHAVRDDLRL
jgi:MinD-like ATPase involved in chromosome partitioning or flagellar assembly